jgi:class 3 adenylate cyclase/tetratricopeptide (TPR) repeat protein
MRCHACSAENPDGDSFCESCGARLGIACLQCGYRNSPSARFCGSCGNALGIPEAELKFATVVFADVVASTALIGGLDPEQARERLQPTVAVMSAAVKRFDGTVVRTLGDGIMAFFGAPRAQEGHALLACEAALAMHAELSDDGKGPAIRVGLHSGRVVSSVAESNPATIAQAHGLAIHLASRIQDEAEPGGTYLTEDCYRLVRPYCDLRPLGPRVLKGFPEPVEIYSLLGLKPSVAGQQFRRHNLTKIRGRIAELDMLRRAFHRAEGGDSIVIGILGSPGSGKSRLCYEFTEWCRARLIPVLETRAQPYGHATPLQSALDVVRLLFGISANDDTESSRATIARQLSALAATFSADLPVLYDFLGIAKDDGPPLRLDPKARRARLFDTVRHLIRQRGAVSSVIIVEDLHWLDEASEEFVATMVDAVIGTRAMLVVNSRPGYAATWMGWPGYEEISLAELSLDDTGALVTELVGSHPGLHEIRQRIIQRSAGNPFFIEELVRSLEENGAVVGEFGNYRLGTSIADGALPATVEAVIGARIDRLGESEKTVLQMGAIIGKEFPLPVLREVADPLGFKIDPILARLCEAELLQEQATIDYRQFVFRHPLIQEVAYATQLKTRRSALHAAVAKAMEGFYRDRLNEFAGLLAYHYEAAGLLAEAANYAARAAMWVGSTNPAQGIKHWEQVRVILQLQPRSKESDSLRIMANGQIAWLGWREGMAADAAKALLDEGLNWARETDDSMIPMLLFVDGRITVASGGSADTYVERVQEALSLVKKPNKVESAATLSVATLNCALSQAFGWAGLLREALAASDAALQDISSVQQFDHQFLGYNVDHWIMSLRARILVRLGRFDEGQKCLDRLLEVEDTLLDPTVRFIPHLGYVDLASCRGDPRLAEEHAERIAEIADKCGLPYIRLYAFACAGTAKSLAKDFVGAERDFVEGLQFVRKATASMGFEPEILASLADCYLRMGRPFRAATVAAESIEVAQQRSTRLAECRAAIIRAAALISAHGSERLAEAIDLFRHAAELIRITGASIYEPLLKQERARASIDDRPLSSCERQA